MLIINLQYLIEKTSHKKDPTMLNKWSLWETTFLSDSNHFATTPQTAKFKQLLYKLPMLQPTDWHFLTTYECTPATKHSSTLVPHHMFNVYAEINTGKFQHNVVYKGLKELGFGKPHSTLFIFPLMPLPAHSTRLLWWGCSPGTLLTQTLVWKPQAWQPVAFQWRKKKKRGGRKTQRKGENIATPAASSWVCDFHPLWM